MHLPIGTRRLFSPSPAAKTSLFAKAIHALRIISTLEEPEDPDCRVRNYLGSGALLVKSRGRV
jgi:hypothetical protein